MGGLYSTLSDKQLSNKLKKIKNNMSDPNKKKKLLYLKMFNSLNKEKDNRLSNATMTIKNLIN